MSGREADPLYTPFGQLAAISAEIAFVGAVDQQLLGDSPMWDQNRLAASHSPFRHGPPVWRNRTGPSCPIHRPTTTAR